MPRTKADVVIVGAGAAGLAAARSLSATGLRVDVLEARDRLGGRLYSLHDATLDMAVELGAEFIHGVPQETLSLARAAGLTIYEMDGDIWRADSGRVVRGGFDMDSAGGLLARMAALDQDMTFAEFLERYGVEADAGAREAAIGYVEGFNAARIDRIGVQAIQHMERAGAAIDGERQLKLAGGYSGLVHALRAGLSPETSRVYFNTVVRHLRWERGDVHIEADSRLGEPLEPFSAARAIIALPLGVLQAPPDEPGGVGFTPALSAKAAALERLYMGQAVRVTLRLRPEFWERELAGGAVLAETNFLFARDDWFGVWWTPAPIRAPLLTGWVGGSKAERLAGQGEAFAAARAIEALTRAFGLSRREVEGAVEAWYTHDWTADPYARGAYSYGGVGGVAAHAALAEPVEDTLYFAGEAANVDGHNGTVHGALASGLHAARAILDALGLTGH